MEQKKIKSIETSTTPLLSSDLVMEELEYDSLMNRHCLKTGSRIICFCAETSECNFLKERQITNQLLK